MLRETSVSEPLRTCRKRIDDVETGEMSLTRDESGGRPDCCPDGIRHAGGVKLSWALARNVGTCVPMRREKSKWEAPMRMRVPKRGAGAEQPVVGWRAL
jgi:hypothetical protein